MPQMADGGNLRDNAVERRAKCYIMQAAQEAVMDK